MKKTKKAYEIVIDSIKEQIMNQELVLGQGLPPEREISEKLGVSRNSVREALKILTVMEWSQADKAQEIIYQEILRDIW
jgi:GntR family transcriptional repressor for pyruvate dehydrogenase complex